MATRVRFAPSPTGEIHIGNIRTALFNWLFARKTGGTFILRIEDTDRERSTKEYESVILQEMEWLGLDYDEGIGAGGEKGPYRQSERLSLYREHVQKLLFSKRAYPCYCSQEELQKMRSEALEKGEMPRYNQKCWHLSKEDLQQYKEEGREPVIRFHLPDIEETLVVKDLIRGDVEFKSSVLDDFVIQKSDGMPTYNYAVVIDDALMEVTHVIRGEDHLSNTPKQILLYRALGFKEPFFAHLGMILDKERKKLSKRSDDSYVFVSQYRAKGYLPQAMLNYLALLGWSHPEEREVLAKEDLIEAFSLEDVNKSPAIFDLEKLNWLNSSYIRQLTIEEMAPLLTPYLIEAGFIEEEEDIVEDLARLMGDSLEYLSMIVEVSSFIFQRPTLNRDDFQDERLKEAFLEISSALQRLEEWEPKRVKEELQKTIKTLSMKGKALYHPLRLSLTGRESGPDLSYVIYLLGVEETIYRLAHPL